MRSRLSLVLFLVILGLTAVTATDTYTRVSKEPIAFAEGSWNAVVIPDTQNYMRFEEHVPIFKEMMQWIADNRKEYNIRLVMFEGDLVHRNRSRKVVHKRFGITELASKDQWRHFREALKPLDKTIPYILVAGNHDYGVKNSDDRKTGMIKHFKLEQLPLLDPAQGGILIEMGPNASGARTLENAAYDLKAPDGRQLLIIALEWAPRNASLGWADGILAREAYKDHTAIIITHAYLDARDRRFNFKKYGSRQDDKGNPHCYRGVYKDCNDGQEMWGKLVSKHANIEMVLCGHVFGDQVGYLASEGEAGNTVHQMMFNAQLDGAANSLIKGMPNGGDGWMRLMEFRPDGMTVQIRTFSPYRQKLKQTCWRTDKQDQFPIELKQLASIPEK